MKNKLWIGIVAVIVGLVAWFAMTSGTRGGQEIEYRYEAIKSGELVRSASATGVLVPLKMVDIKSKAGGTIEKLVVEEGDLVKAGDVVAMIDPRDTKASYDQASADSNSAAARVAQARNEARLQALNAVTSVKDAENRVRQAEIALAKARENAVAQPKLTDAEIRSAQAALDTQKQALAQLERVDAPSRRKDAETSVSRTESELRTAKAELDRQQRLFDLGYVAKSALERAQSSYDSAFAANQVAKEKLRTIEASISADLDAQRARVRQAEMALSQSKTRSNQITLAQQDLADARRALEAAKIAKQKAEDDRLSVESRRLDIKTAEASAVRSRVAQQNAKVQLDSTTVLAPRDGVVTIKYLEEGTIIPPGTSTFSQGTSIVQLADVSRMFVDCTVDEADIASVFENQQVRIVVEAYPGKKLNGKVRKVFPSATTANNLTNIKVRVEISDLNEAAKDKLLLRPGMNATCEFVEYFEPNALVLPQQALKHEGDSDYVLIKSSDPKKPEKRTVKVGESGNEGVAIVDGLKDGDEVVVAEIDLAAMRDRLNKMQQSQQPGGLGSQSRGGPSQSRRTGGTAGGGGGSGGGR